MNIEEIQKKIQEIQDKIKKTFIYNEAGKLSLDHFAVLQEELALALAALESFSPEKRQSVMPDLSELRALLNEKTSLIQKRLDDLSIDLNQTKTHLKGAKAYQKTSGYKNGGN